MDDAVYDLCIVGAGMFGSAAARHASAMEGVKVCLIGPDEPTPEEKCNREIFGAHYDEGRITRIFLDNNIPSQILARNSTSRYRELEKLSGISFYQPVGFLCILKKDSAYLKNVLKWSENCPVEDLSNNESFKSKFPFIKLEENDYPLFDNAGAGHISPRKLVAAQKKVAEKQNCDIIREAVNEVKPLINGIHEIVTEMGKVIKAKRVLICTGAFTNLKKFPIPKLKINNNKETVVFFKLSPQEAERLSSMPSITYRNPDDKIGAYILPPIQYPNGSIYLKIGHIDYDYSADQVNNLQKIKEWYFSRGDPKKIDFLSKFLIELLPGQVFENISTETCVTSTTPTKLPYIDRVSETVTVAASSSASAKSSDEVGRIAAVLSLTGRWDSELNKSDFQIVLDAE